MIALRWFCNQRKDISNTIYICIVTVDVITCLLMLPPAISYLNNRQPKAMKYGVVCNAWGVMFTVTSRLSVFLVAVLSISRTISVRFPFSKIRRTHVILPTAIYTVILVSVALLPFFYGNKYIYDHVAVLCLWTIIDNINPQGIAFTVLYIIFFILPFLLPFFPILTSCSVSVFVLRGSKKFTGVRRGLHQQRKYASHTIILFTMIYIVCNFPVNIFYVLEVTQFILTHKYNFPPDVILPVNNTPITYMRLILVVYCVGINAAINPFLYTIRMKAFSFVSRSIRRYLNKGLQITQSKGSKDADPTQT